MVKVVGPLYSYEARGRLGPNEYNSWRGIDYVKSHVDPPKPESEKQLEQQAAFKELSGMWKLLTQAQRDAWNAWAAAHPHSDWCGQMVRMSGFNAYIKCNSISYKWTFTENKIPPVQKIMPVITTMHIQENFEAVWHEIHATWTTCEDPDNTSAELRFTKSPSLGQVPDFKHAVMHSFYAATSDPMTLNDLEFQDPARYGFWIRSVNSITGQTTTWQMIEDVDPWNGWEPE